MAWPYGIADPHLYAYLAAAAASYPYSISPSNSNPFNYYSTLGLQRPTNNIGQFPSPGPIRPRSEIIPGMTGAALLRSSAMPIPHSIATTTQLNCSMLPPTDSLLSHSHSNIACSNHTDSCSCSPLFGGLSNLPTTLPSVQAPKAHSNTTSQGLFRPFQSDVDRSWHKNPKTEYAQYSIRVWHKHCHRDIFFYWNISYKCFAYIELILICVWL